LIGSIPIAHFEVDMPRISVPFLAAFLAIASCATATTIVPGGNLINQTWTTASHPYIVQGDLTVPPGSTFTIQPGVVVEFFNNDAQAAGLDPSRIELTILGTFNASGTNALPITFQGVNNNPGIWYGIVVGSGAVSASLAHVNLSNASNGIRVETPTNGIVTLSDATLDLNTFDVWKAGAGLPTLGGRITAGRFNGNVTVPSGATLALNRTIGLVQSGNLSLQGTLEATLTSPANYEQIQVQGSIILAGPLVLDVAGLTATTGDMFTLIDNFTANPVSGTFTGLPNGSQFNAGSYRFQISYTGGTGNDVVLTVVPAQQPCDLAVGKSGPASTTFSSGGIAYTLTVQNLGAGTATDVVVRDSLPSGLRYASAVPSQGTCTESGGKITCSLGDIAPAGSANVAIGTSFDLDTLIVVNTVVATSPTPDANGGNNTASATTVVHAGTTGVGEIPAEDGRLRPVRIGPNPASQATRVFFAARPGGIAEVRIFDAAGRHVRTLKGVVGDGGAGQIVWDGRTEAGTAAPSGVFHYQVVVDGQTIGSERAVLIR